MSEHPRIVYRQHPNVSSEDELNLLVSVYAFIVRAREAKLAGEDGGEDTTKEKQMSFTRGASES